MANCLQMGHRPESFREGTYLTGSAARRDLPDYRAAHGDVRTLHSRTASNRRRSPRLVRTGRGEKKRFVQGEDRTQSFLLPEALDDYVTDTNPVRVVDVFVDELDLHKLGFEGVEPALTGRPSYHPGVMLKIYIYGYLNRIQSSRRLEREAQRNVELMWLTSRLAPDFKTIARFRKDNGKAIRSVCREFVVLCQRLDLFAEAFVAIDGSKFKAVNHRDRNFTSAKLERRMRDIEASIARYL